jgi:hypothetical protein
VPDSVQPAHLWIPPRLGSYGDEAVDLARLAGRELDAEQEVAVDAMLSYGPGGRWAAFESAIIEARQNGKTGGVLLPVVLFDLFSYCLRTGSFGQRTCSVPPGMRSTTSTASSPPRRTCRGGSRRSPTPTAKRRSSCTPARSWSSWPARRAAAAAWVVSGW